MLLQDTGWEPFGLSSIVTKDTESHVSLPYCPLAYEHIRGQFTELMRAWLIKTDLQVMISYELGNQDSHWETAQVPHMNDLGSLLSIRGKTPWIKISPLLNFLPGLESAYWSFLKFQASKVFFELNQTPGPLESESSEFKCWLSCLLIV